MPNRACEVTEQPANEPEPEGRQEWAESNAESNEVTPDEDVYASLQKNSQVDDSAVCKDEEKSEPQDEVEETTSLVEVAPKPEPNSRLGSFFAGSWRLWSLPWDKHFSSRPSTSAEHSSEGELLVSDEDIDSRLNDQQAPDIVGIESWQVVDSGGLVVAEDDAVDAIHVGRGSVEAKMERMLTWMLAPAVHGIPKLGVLPAEERAAELLAQHDRDVEAAVREVVAGSERSVSTVVLNFCLERIPVLGCPTVLLKTTWGNLRSIVIIAAMYGHDLESARVQHEALLCLVPPGDDKDSCAAALKQQNASPDLNPAVFVSTTAQQVAHFMIRGALRRATGLQAAVDCFELASLLYSSCGTDALDEDGFVHFTATPASAARDFFS